MFTSIGKINYLFEDCVFSSRPFWGKYTWLDTIYWFYFFVEPGYYKDNDFGIRIEDIAVIVPTPTKVDAALLLTS